MSELSHAAQAVINAAVEAGGGYGQATPVLHARLAAALRAAVEQCTWEDKFLSAERILAIATELEAQ